MEKEADEHQDGSQQQVFILSSESSIKTVKSAKISTHHPLYNAKVIEERRKCSRYVAYADMGVTLAAFVQCAFVLVMVSWLVHKIHQNEGFQGVKMTESIVLTLSMLQLASHLRGFWMVFQLYSATKPLTPQEEAVESATSWRNFHVYQIILALVVGTVTSKSGPSIGSLNFLWLVIRIGFVLIVHKFIYEILKCCEASEVMARRSAARVRPVMTVTVSETNLALQPTPTAPS